MKIVSALKNKINQLTTPYYCDRSSTLILALLFKLGWFKAEIINILDDKSQTKLNVKV